MPCVLDPGDLGITLVNLIGNTVEQARNNLAEALELIFEHASESEIKERLHGKIFITRLEVAVG